MDGVRRSAWIGLVGLATTTAAWGACDDCANIAYDPTCFEITGTQCIGTPGTLIFHEGAPGPPAVVASCICNNCNGLGEAIVCRYTKTTGLKFCLTLTGGFAWGMPIGPNWSVELSGQVCWDTKRSVEAEFNVGCVECRRKRGRMLVREVPITVEVPVSHRLQLFSAGDCAPGLSTVPCYDTSVIVVNTSVNEYEAIWDLLPCGPPPVGPRCPDADITPEYLVRTHVEIVEGDDVPRRWSSFVEREYITRMVCGASRRPTPYSPCDADR